MITLQSLLVLQHKEGLPYVCVGHIDHISWNDYPQSVEEPEDYPEVLQSKIGVELWRKEGVLQQSERVGSGHVCVPVYVYDDCMFVNVCVLYTYVLCLADEIYLIQYT